MIIWLDKHPWKTQPFVHYHAGLQQHVILCQSSCVNRSLSYIYVRQDWLHSTGIIWCAFGVEKKVSYWICLDNMHLVNKETTQQFTLTMERERIEGSNKMLQNSKRFKDVRDEIVSVFTLVAQIIGNIVLRLLWHFLHLIISFWHVLRSTTLVLQSYLISSGLLKKYKALDLSNLQYLAVVVQSEEVHDISRLIKLLQWLSQIGVKHVCLYDMDGVLKESKKVILQNFGDARLWEPESDENDILLDQNQMTLEFASFSDGKAGIAKAANHLCSKYLKIASLGGDWTEPVFTEFDMSSALRVVGCEWPEPNLLLTYGSVRCHLGFPAWRMRYTEIVHMGPLKSMKYGALVKVIEEFTRVKQNYGT